MAEDMSRIEAEADAHWNRIDKAICSLTVEEVLSLVDQFDGYGLTISDPDLIRAEAAHLGADAGPDGI